MRTMDLRDGLRLLRSAPAYRVETVAAAAGVAAGSLRSAMHQLRTRGRCAALLVDAADRGKIRDRVAVLSLRACPPGMVRAASGDHHESGRAVAVATAGWAERPLGTNSARRLLAVAARSKDVMLRGEAAKNASGMLLCRLSSDPDANVRAATAANSSCPAVSLIDLSSHPHSGVRWRVANNPATPAAALCSLSRKSDYHYEIRAAVAVHPACPLSVLERASSDPEALVRRKAAEHPLCPTGVLESLSTDSDLGVRIAVAEHPSCPAATLQSLSTDSNNYQVRIAVAEHLSCPAETLERLSRDPHYQVRQHANQR